MSKQGDAGRGQNVLEGRHVVQLCFKNVRGLPHPLGSEEGVEQHDGGKAPPAAACQSRLRLYVRVVRAHRGVLVSRAEPACCFGACTAVHQPNHAHVHVGSELRAQVRHYRAQDA